MINYNELKEIQKQERESSFLSKIPMNFYEECSNYFCKLESQLDIDIDFRIYHNAFLCYTEIIERRLDKITQTAFFTIVRKCKLNQKPDWNILVNESPSNILKAEKELFINLLENYFKFYNLQYNNYIVSKTMEDN